MKKGIACALALVGLGASGRDVVRVAQASDPVPTPAPHTAPIPYPPPSPRILAQPDASYDFGQARPYPSFAWLATQLLPSPEVGVGKVESAAGAPREAAFGLRWQVTPLLWSWGTNRRVSRWRTFVVDPLARHSGSIELSGTIEYLWGHVDRALVRPGVRGYLPLAHRGEYLSVSLGTSTYSYDGKMRVAYDVGAYILYGIFGVQATVAPDHAQLGAIATLRIRYF